VRAVITLIESGDCYQVNLTRRLTWDDVVDPAALHAAVERANGESLAPEARSCETPH
jgi:anthranilate/para-aminobenzoate synthase component I